MFIEFVSVLIVIIEILLVPINTEREIHNFSKMMKLNDSGYDLFILKANPMTLIKMKSYRGGGPAG